MNGFTLWKKKILWPTDWFQVIILFLIKVELNVVPLLVIQRFQSPFTNPKYGVLCISPCRFLGLLTNNDMALFPVGLFFGLAFSHFTIIAPILAI